MACGAATRIRRVPSGRAEVRAEYAHPFMDPDIRVHRDRLKLVLSFLIRSEEFVLGVKIPEDAWERGLERLGHSEGFEPVVQMSRRSLNATY